MIIRGNIMGGGNAALLIEKGIITDTDFKGTDKETLDFGDCLVLPGFVDIHIHGGGGCDFVDMTEESFNTIRDMHLKKGTTTVCPTLTSCDISKTFDFLEYYRNFKNKECFAGVHLEGPFLSKEMCGAQNLSHLISPTPEIIDRLVSFKDVISSVTLAPELTGTVELLSKLTENGIKASVGHSNASADVLSQSGKLGADKITHMYCATPKRYKEGSFVIGGFEERALTDDSFSLELIADGHHVCRECFEMAIRCKGIDKVIAISDAMRGAGLENAKESFLGEVKPENRVIIEDGVAKLPDRSSFAGSVTDGEKMFSVLCQKYGFSASDCSKMLSENPARYIGLEKTGKIQKGYYADLVIIDKNFKVIRTFKKGRC